VKARRQAHPGVRVLQAPLDALGFDEAVQRILSWARRRESRHVCFVNVHATVTAGRDKAFAHALLTSDLNLPDGAPVAWMMRRLAWPQQPRISGPDVMESLCEEAARQSLHIFLLGGTPDTLALLQTSLQQRWPSLRLAGALSPPFRALTDTERHQTAQAINDSGAHIVFVGLGCPKQELWMDAQHSRINAVMLGVGAAFDFHAGTLRRAPLWMRRVGLEWLHRLVQEPRRLVWRYVSTGSQFALGAAAQLLALALAALLAWSRKSR
jgi:N-acetylglucosaminyldiphosphoundecaprenol N-acetyl-beta-D-mannosaminyltransferase